MQTPALETLEIRNQLLHWQQEIELNNLKKIAAKLLQLNDIIGCIQKSVPLPARQTIKFSQLPKVAGGDPQKKYKTVLEALKEYDGIISKNKDLREEMLFSEVLSQINALIMENSNPVFCGRNYAASI